MKTATLSSAITGHDKVCPQLMSGAANFGTPQLIPLVISRTRRSLWLLAMLLMLLLLGSGAMAEIRTSTATGGPWNAEATWVGGTIPSNTDQVVIATTGSNSVTGASAGTTYTCAGLTINSGSILIMQCDFIINGVASISGTINFGSTSSTNRTMAFNGDVTLNSGAVWNETDDQAVADFSFSGNFTNNATTFTAQNNSTAVHIFTGTAKTLSGTTITAIPYLTINGTTTNNGTLDVNATLAGTSSLIQGINSTLLIGGTISLTTLTATNAGNTVNYYGTAQTAKVVTYNNLTLSGSGAKIFATTPTVNGVLSMEGTATVAVTTGVVTYGTNAKLQYNTATSRTVSSEEWITPFVARGGVTIKNTGTITLDAGKQIGDNTNVPLNINSGATLSTSANNFELRFHGSFINDGILTAGNSFVIIAGKAATQSIDGVTTTGTVYLLKTDGTATFTGNVNGGALTVNGAGGTFNLGVGLTHTFTGAWTRTFGTLNGGSSLLRIGGSSSGTGAAFTAGTGTVEWYASGAQTITGVAYYNLTLSGSGAKTIAGAITVSGNLLISGSATATPTTSLAVTGNTTLSGTSVLTLGAANLLSSAPVILDGGTFRTGATTGFAETVGTLVLTDNSTIALGTGSHNLNFSASNGATWTTGKTLTITGWTGTSGTSGTAGKIYFGTSASGLIATQLAQISFAGFSGTPILLNTGELVPLSAPILAITGTPTNHGSKCVGTAANSITYTITNTGATANGVTVSSSDPQFVVSGVPTTVTGGGTATYLVTFTPASSGAQNATITVSSTVPGSNSPTNSLTGTGNALPVAGTITGGNAVCMGSTLALASHATGIGDLTYTWASSDITKATINASTGVVTLVAPGTTNITYTVTDGTTLCSSISENYPVTVNTLPVLTVSTISISGCQVHLLSAVTDHTGDLFYYPSGSPLSILPLTAQTTITIAGYYRIQARIGDCLSEQEVNVTINEKPTILLVDPLNMSVCSGKESVELSYSGISGSPTKYSIVFDQGGFANVEDERLYDSPLIISVPSMATAGIYTGMLTVKNGTDCMSEGYSITITVLPRPQVNLNWLAKSTCSGVPTNIVLPIVDDSPAHLPITKYYITSDAQSGQTNDLETTDPNAISGDVLINNSNDPITVSYYIFPYNGDCEGNGFFIDLTVQPVPEAPTPHNNLVATYTGVEQTASATPAEGSHLAWFTTATGSTLSVTPSGISAGTYKAWAESVDNNSGCVSATRTEVTLIIGKALLAVTAAAPDITYGNEAPTVTLNYSGFIHDEDHTVLNNEGFTLGSDYTKGNSAGTYHTTISIGSAVDNNYEFVIPLNTSTFLVGKANLSVTAVAENIAYGSAGASVTFVISGIISPDGLGDLDNVGFILGTDYMKGNMVGIYHTTIAMGTAFDNNYNFTSLKTSDFVVGPAALTIMADHKSKEYDGFVYNQSSFTATYDGFVNIDGPSDLIGTLTFSGDAITAINAGLDYAIIPSGLTSGNYTITFVEGKLDITKKELTVTADDQIKTYDGLTFIDGGGTFTSSIAGFINLENISVVTGILSYTGQAMTITGAGTHNITPVVTGLNATNYSFTSADGNLQIDKADQTITWENPADITYNAALTAVQLNAQVAGVAGGTAIGEVTYAPVIGVILNAGDNQYLRVDVAETANYNAATKTVSININRAEATVSIIGGTFTYDASAQTASGFAYGVGGESDVLIPAVTFSYIGTGSTVYPATADAPTTAGTYSVTASFAGNNDYNPAAASANIIIGKATPVITLIVGSNPNYNGAAHYVTGATVAGVGAVNLGDATVVYEQTGTEVANPTNAGVYDVTADFAETANYNAAVQVTGRLTITKAEAVVSVTPYSVGFDGNAHTATGTAKGVNNEYLPGLDLKGTTHTVAGIYNNDPWTFAESTNYNAKSGTVSDAIGKANAAIVVDGFVGPYDALEHGASITTAAGVLGEDLRASINLGAKFSDVPGGTAHWTFSNPNYADQSGNVAIEIGEAVITVTANSANKTYGKTKTYAGTEFTTSGNFYNGDKINSVTLSSSGDVATAAVNTYPIVASSALGSGLNNYIIHYNSGNLAVDPKALEIIANSFSKEFFTTHTFDQTIPSQDFTVTGLEASDAVSSVTLVSDGSAETAAVGHYDILISNAVGSGLENYAISYTNGILNVQDNAAPVAKCKPATVLLDANGNGSITVEDIDDGSSDASGIKSMTLDKTTFNCSNYSQNTVTLTITDNNNLVSTCTASVTVEDNVEPVITSCPASLNNMPATTGLCSASAIDVGMPVAADNCDGTLTIAGFRSDGGTMLNAANHVGAFPVGTTTITWNITDIHGNSNSCVQTVTVIDPQLTLTSVPVSANADQGICSASNVTIPVPTPSLVCAVTGLISQRSDGNSLKPLTDPYNVGITTITWTALGANNVPVATCTQTVTVVDNQAPVLADPSDIVADNETGFCYRIVNLAIPAATDNCGISTAGVSASGIPLDNKFPVGTTVVTWSVTDVHGNIATKTQNVVVADVDLPVITSCPVDQIFCKKENNFYDIPLLIASDNCGINTINYSVTGATTRSGSANNASGSFNVGVSTITWFVTDLHGKNSSCTTTVTVNPIPIATIIGDARVCINAPTPLITFTGTSGTAPYTFVYSVNDGSDQMITSTGNTATVPQSTETPGTFKYTLKSITDANGCSQTLQDVITATINVNESLIAPIAGVNQTICYNVTPAPLTVTTVASGGTGPFAYQWQSSTNGTTNWTNVGTGTSFAPGILRATIYYRIVVSDAGIPSCGSDTSNVVKITVGQSLTQPRVGANQGICYNTVPAPITVTAPVTGGSGSYTYFWEMSTDNANWSDIDYSGESYTPSALTANMWYRVNGVDNILPGCGSLVSSNVVKITVQKVVKPGVIAGDQTICAGITPAAFTSTTPVTGSGIDSYQWQSSTTEGGQFTDITSATDPTYQPGTLTADTWFRRVGIMTQLSNSCSANSNVVKVTVNPLPGAVAGADRTICMNASTTLGATAVEGSTYSWTSEPAGFNSTEANPTVSPAETTTYTVIESISATRCTNSHSVVITVNPLPTVTLTPAGPFCIGSATVQLAGLPANGTYSGSGVRESGLFTPSATGDHVITYTYTDENGCTNSASITITVSPHALLQTIINGVTVTSNNDGVDDTGAFSICSSTNNVQFTVFNDLNGVLPAANVKAYQQIIKDNVTAPFCNNCAVPLTVFAEATGTIALANSSLPGKLTMKFRAFVDSNNNNIIDDNECAGDWIVYTVTVNPDVTAGTIIGAGPLCIGTTATYTCDGTSGGSWSSTNTGVATVNSSTGAVMALDSGTTDITYTVSSGCGSPISSLETLTVNPLLPVSVSVLPSANPVCTGTSVTFTATPVGGGTTPTYQWFKNTFAVVTDATYTYVPVNGDIVYVVMTSSLACAAGTLSTSNAVNMIVNPRSLGGSVSGGSTICSGSNSGLLTLSGNTGTVVKWQSSVSPFNAWTDIANTAKTYTSGALTQTTRFRAVVQNGNCATANSSAATVTVNSGSIGGSVSGGSMICSGSNSGLLILSGNTGTVVKWQKSVLPFSAWTDIANTATTYTSGALIQTTRFRAVVQSGRCATANSSAATVTVNSVSIGGSVSGGSTICSGSNSGLLTLSGNTGTVVKWQRSVSPFSVWRDIANTATTYISGALTQTTRFRAVVQNGSCATANSSAATVTVNSGSIGGSVSGGSTICSGSNSGLLTLSGNIGTVVKWQSSVSPFSVWRDIANTATTYISGALTQTTRFRAVVQSGSCATANSSAATVTVNSGSIGGSVSGGSTICSGSNSGLLTLSGNTGTVVKWQSSVSPFSVWRDIANTATTYTSGALTQTTRFRAVVQSGSCVTANSSAATVAVSSLPATPVVSIIQPNCTIATGIITVTAPLGAGLTYSINGVTYQGSTIFCGLASGSYTVKVKNTGGCISVGTGVRINARPAAITVSATAGAISTFGGKTTLTISVAGGVSPYTYALNSGAFQNANTFTIGAGTYTINVKDANGCTGTSNTVTITQPSQGNRATTLSYTGDRTVQYGSRADLSATLRWGSSGIRNEPIIFTIGSQSVTGMTNSLGRVTATLLITQAPGNYCVVAAFAGDATYRNSRDNHSFTVTRRSVIVGLTGTVSKVYDGSTSATISPANYVLTSIIAGDFVSLNNPTVGRFDNRNVGRNKQISVNGLALIGINAGKYSLTNTSVSAKIGTITSSNKSALIETDASIIPTIRVKVYPNPSHGPVTFDFNISVNAKVTLDIFASSGQRIARIFDADVDTDVTQTVIFDVPLSSGVYIYVLKWNDQVVTGKLIRTR